MGFIFLAGSLSQAGVTSGTICRLSELLLELSALRIEHLDHLPSHTAAAALYTALGMLGYGARMAAVAAQAACDGAYLVELSQVGAGVGTRWSR